MDDAEAAKRKCTHEIKALFHRWEEESDLDSEEIMEAVSDAIGEYYDEEVIEFEADEGLDLDSTEEGS